MTKLRFALSGLADFLLLPQSTQLRGEWWKSVICQKRRERMREVATERNTVHRLS